MSGPDDIYDGTVAEVRAMTGPTPRDEPSPMLDEWMRTGHWPPDPEPPGGWTPPRLVAAIRAEYVALTRREPLVLPPDTVCACLDETGERKVRLYERCERCGAFMEADR